MNTASKLTMKGFRSGRHWATASVLALSTAAVTAMSLPSSVYQAIAIVAVDEPSAALRLATARSAADLAVSKPIVLRAAASLNGTEMAAPAPAFTDKIKVAAGLAGATGTIARLAEAIGVAVSAQAGAGLVAIVARSGDAVRASRIATAVGEALVFEEETSIAASARHRESSAMSTIEQLRTQARLAHTRLASLGASELDPSEALASAAATARAAEARLAAVHAVIAAGSPPLGAGRELPQSAATLQQTYWDLKKQLDKASETLGERHTTVIALRDGVTRAAASLTAEWQKIERTAASDASDARSREASLRKTADETGPDKSAAADARAAVRLADAALRRAEAEPVVARLDGSSFRLVAPAAVPASTVGLGAWQRALLASGAGLAIFGLALLPRRRRQLSEAAVSAAPRVGKVLAAARPVTEATQREPLSAFPVADTLTDHPPSSATQSELAVQASTPVRAVESQMHEDQSSYDHLDEGWLGFEPDDFFDEETAALPHEDATFEGASTPSLAEASPDSPTVRALDPDLRDALRAIADGLGGMAPSRATPPTVMVASNASGADTATIALALGEITAELGSRVLVIEAESARPSLAEAVAPDAEPILVDAFGALRVALPAESGGGLVLAPAFRDGARIAAALARNTKAALVDDLAGAFDVIVVDGGRAADSAEAGWTADAFIRVGRFASQRDDTHLLEVFHAPSDAMLGTVAAGRFVAWEEPTPEPRVAVHSALRSVSTSFDLLPSGRAKSPTTAPLRVPPRRRISSR